jgi:hypothetical protein
LFFFFFAAAGLGGVVWCELRAGVRAGDGLRAGGASVENTRPARLGAGVSVENTSGMVHGK